MKNYLVFCVIILLSAGSLRGTNTIDSLIKGRDNLYLEYMLNIQTPRIADTVIIKSLEDIVIYDYVIVNKAIQLDSTLEATQYNLKFIQTDYDKIKASVDKLNFLNLILYASIVGLAIILIIYMILLYIARRRLRRIKNGTNLPVNKEISKSSKLDKYFYKDMKQNQILPESRQKMDELELNIAKIEKLNALKESKAITEEEFVKLKQKIFNEF